MIFYQLTIKNFRQFMGEQKIIFATDKYKNVTVIHGFNGAGKTTLLNVFTWLFYGEFSPDFENPEYLYTESAFSTLKTDQDLVTSAQLIFEDKGKTYTAERKQVIGKNLEGQPFVKEPPKLTLDYRDETGDTHRVGNPKDSLEQLLPKPLYPFFFFNGERIEKLASSDAYEEIESGVKVLLDIEVFDRAINHLDGEVMRHFRDEIARHSNEDGQKAHQELRQFETKKEEAQENLQELISELKTLQEEKNIIDTKISDIPELAKWQEQRESKERELKVQQEQSKENKNKLAKEFSRNGYLLLIFNKLIKAEKILLAAHEKGELPIPMKRQFVSELLEKGQCICGRSLIKGENAHNSVKEWRDKVGSDELESEVSVTKAKLASLFKRRDDFIQEISVIQQRQDQIHKEIQRLYEELSELSNLIGNRQYAENHSKLESRRKEIDIEIIRLSIEINNQEDEIKKLDSQIKDKEREIKKIDKVDEQGKLAQRRLEALSNIKFALEKIRQVRHQQLSKDLSHRLDQVWSQIAIKDYKAKLDERYHLSLTKTVGDQEERVRGASTGEKQVLSLAFIGSLLDKARSTYDEKGDQNQTILFKGGVYPLVIDSAFGQLEPEYKRDVAEWLPKLARQVIVLVSESQWKKEVEEKLQPRIEHQYILECCASKKRSKKIRLYDQEYPYVGESHDGLEKTKIIEVEI